MNIAIAQMNTTPGDFEATFERMCAQAELARDKGAELIVFPYPVLTGSNPGGLGLSEEFSLDLALTLDRLSSALVIPALVPFSSAIAGTLVVEVAYIAQQHVTPLRLGSLLDTRGQQKDDAAQQMAELAKVGDEASFEAGLIDEFEFDESLEILDFSSAFETLSWISNPAVLDQVLPLEFAALKLGVCTSYAALTMAAKQNTASSYDALIYIPTASFNADDELSSLAPAVADGCYVADADAANAWLACAAAVGGYDAEIYCGGSFVMAPWGELAAVAPSFEESLLICEIDPAAEGPLSRALVPPAYQRSTQLWDALSLATHDYIYKAKKSEVVLALYGDLASSALATLASDALGPVHVHAVIANTGDTAMLSDARKLAQNLRLDVVAEISAADGVTGIEALVEAACASQACELDAVVLDAGDKTHFALELTGAQLSAASLAPFGDVYRSDVAALIRQRMTVSPTIPPSSLSRVAVPDCAPEAASAEEQLSMVDAVLLLHIERRFGLSDVVSEGTLDYDAAARLLERVAHTELWRRSAAPALIVSDRTLAERDWPVGHAWTDKQRGEEIYRQLDSLYERVEGAASMFSQFKHMPEEQNSSIADAISFMRDFSMSRNWGASPDPFSWGLFSEN